MSNYLDVDSDQLKSTNSYWTAREICQQPRVWREAYAAVDARREAISHWLDPLLCNSNLRIILSGAGTSSFIGEALKPWLHNRLRRRIEAISTTDLVSAPEQYLAEDVPTLLVSFARSGESPESVASIKLADQMLEKCHHLVLTCNPKGHLAKLPQSDNLFCLLMPDGTNDRGFAMTSSYSSMLVSCLAIFSPNSFQLEETSKIAQQLIDTELPNIRALSEENYTRLVILGAGCLLGTAREASLKSLELSAGKVVPVFDTPLGFRHGPKSIVDKTTIIVLLGSSDPYTQAYDDDLLNELKHDNHAQKIIALSPGLLGIPHDGLEDIWLSLPYVLYCQILAFYKSLSLSIDADNPFPLGEVNRVVKGARIHEYKRN